MAKTPRTTPPNLAPESLSLSRPISPPEWRSDEVKPSPEATGVPDGFTLAADIGILKMSVLPEAAGIGALPYR